MWLVKQHPIARTVWKGSWAKNAVVELLYKSRKWWNFSYTLRHVYAWQFWAWCGYVRMILAVIVASNKCVTGWCSMMFPILISNLSCFDFAWFCMILHIRPYQDQVTCHESWRPSPLRKGAETFPCRTSRFLVLCPVRHATTLIISDHLWPDNMLLLTRFDTPSNINSASSN